MPDRPAAELLYEWNRALDFCARNNTDPDDGLVLFGSRQVTEVLERLARAEQALAALGELADDFDAHGRWASAADIRAVLRASQGGQ